MNTPSVGANKEDLDFNQSFQHALELLEKTHQHVFITGRAGTGKSTLLQYFRDHTYKSVVVLAPTGVAAVNIQGQTIHSFFRFKPDISPEAVALIKLRPSQKEIYRKLKTLIIDEISMVRADLLDSIDTFLRRYGPNPRQPLGGVQIVMFGDLYQLPPVVTPEEKKIFKDIYPSPYFFDAKVIRHLDMAFIELEKIYRQKDVTFINLLNAIRNNSVEEKTLRLLNERYLPHFVPKEEDFYIYLTTTNVRADEINLERLGQLPMETYHYEGKMTGAFERKSLPTHVDLELKVGAQVMLLNNDPTGRWINGTIGKILSIEIRKNKEDVIQVELAEGERVEVVPFTWEMYRFSLDEESGEITSEVTGSFTQYPLRLAWAVTIHKAQGKTFSKVIIDIDRGTFSHGQIYVALSRSTSLEGIVLKKPIQKRHILMDWRVVEFLTRYQYRKSEQMCSLEEKRKILETAIADGREIEIVYLKPNDEKSRRVIAPRFVGEMEYLGKTYFGVEGYCPNRGGLRVFRLDRILEIHTERRD